MAYIFYKLTAPIEKLEEVNKLLKKLGEDLEKISLLPHRTYAREIRLLFVFWG
jgi:uncharacterized protein (DUF2384 family)